MPFNKNFLKIWRTRNLKFKTKLPIFKTSIISKVIHLALVTNVPHIIIDQLIKIQKDFIWNQNYSKIRHSTFCNSYENGELKSVDIRNKLNRLNTP